MPINVAVSRKSEICRHFI